MSRWINYWILGALGLDGAMVSKNHKPLEINLLVKDKYGITSHGQFIYSFVMGMLMYLAGHTRPNIAYAANCFTW